MYLFEVTDQLEPDGLYRVRHHTLVTIAFYGVDNLNLSGFSHLNELHGIQFHDIADRGLELLKWEVSFDGSLGMCARFLCGRIAVLQIRSLDGPPPRLHMPL